MSSDSLLGREMGPRSPGYKERAWCMGSTKWVEYLVSMNIWQPLPVRARNIYPKGYLDPNPVEATR